MLGFIKLTDILKEISAGALAALPDPGGGSQHPY